MLSGSHTTAWSHEVGLGPKSSPAQAGLRADFPRAPVPWAGESHSAFAKPSEMEVISQL